MGKLTIFTGYRVPDNIYDLEGVVYLAKGVLSLESYFKIIIAHQTMVRTGNPDQMIKILSQFGLTSIDEFYGLEFLSRFNLDKFMKEASESHYQLKIIREDYIGLTGVLNVLARRQKETFIVGETNPKLIPIVKTCFEKMCKIKRIFSRAVLVDGISELKPRCLGGKSIWAINGNSLDRINDPGIEPGTPILISHMERGYLLPYFLNPQKNQLFATCDAFDGVEVVDKYNRILVSN